MIRRMNFALILATTLLWGCGQAGGDARSLTSAVTEAAGDNCPTGGQKILSGVDANGNGILEAEEVLNVSFVCNGQPIATCDTLQGDVTIFNNFDWAALVERGCTRVTGTLRIDAPGATMLGAPSPLVEVGGLEISSASLIGSLGFPALTTVNGDLLVSANGVGSLSLPALASVGGALTVQVDALNADAPILTDLQLPSLATVGGPFSVDQAFSLTELDLPELTSVGQYLTISLPTALTRLTLPKLASVPALTITGAGLVTSLELPALASVVNLSITDNPALLGLSLPELTTLGPTDGSTWTGACSDIQGNAAMTSLSLPKLATVTDCLGVGSQALPALSLPSLTSAFMLTLDGPSLATLELPVLATSNYLTIIGTALTSLDLSALVAGPPRLNVSNSPLLTSFTPPSATELSGLRLQNTGLAAVDMPWVTWAAFSIIVTDNPALTHVDFSGLTHTGPYRAGGDPVYGVAFLRNVALTSISLPALTDAGDFVQVYGNTALTSLSMPLLTAARMQYQVYDNPVLAQCQVDGLFNQLTLKPRVTTSTFYYKVTGNDTTGTCP